MPTGHFKRTEEHKRNISLALTGKQKSLEHRKKLSDANKGKVTPEETRKLISKRIRESFGLPQKEWEGTTIGSWTNEVKKRDNYTCQKCGNTDRRVLVADHIKSKSMRPDLRLELSNGMTLCQNCHAIKTYEDKEYREHMRKNHWKNYKLIKQSA